jgi:hypothetical protein
MPIVHQEISRAKPQTIAFIKHKALCQLILINDGFWTHSKYLHFILF